MTAGSPKSSARSGRDTVVLLLAGYQRGQRHARPQTVREHRLRELVRGSQSQRRLLLERPVVACHACGMGDPDDPVTGGLGWLEAGEGKLTAGHDVCSFFAARAVTIASSARHITAVAFAPATATANMAS